MIKMNKIKGNKKVINVINKNENIDINTNRNDIVILNYFNNNASSMDIKINQSDDSYVVINYVIINQREINININGEIKGNNNKIIINVRALVENSHANINVCVKVDSDTLNNEVIEDLKGINEEGTITFMPILEVDTNDVDAEHYAVVGSFDENKLFYLQSKGLSLNEAKRLLKNSFIFNLFSDEFINMIDK